MAVTISVSDKFESTRFMLYWYEIEVVEAKMWIKLKNDRREKRIPKPVC